jgi:hypothetical protein
MIRAGEPSIFAAGFLDPIRRTSTFAASDLADERQDGVRNTRCFE